MTAHICSVKPAHKERSPDFPTQFSTLFENKYFSFPFIFLYMYFILIFKMLYSWRSNRVKKMRKLVCKLVYKSLSEVYISSILASLCHREEWGILLFFFFFLITVKINQLWKLKRLLHRMKIISFFSALVHCTFIKSYFLIKKLLKHAVKVSCGWMNCWSKTIWIWTMVLWTF